MFIFINNTYCIDPQMIGIKILKVIWDRDTHPKKLLASAQLKWLYYMYHPKSIFLDFREDDKSEKIIETIAEPLLIPEWDVEHDLEMQNAIKWYIAFVRVNPLWDAYDAYTQAAYNLANIVRSKDSTANEIKTARTELDSLPTSLKKMKEQAEKTDIIHNKVAGDKDIKRGERLPASANH